MGKVVLANCECGFKTDEMYLGGGKFSYATWCNYPNYCKGCKSLFEANMYDDIIYCKKCKSSDTLRYDHPSMVKDLTNRCFDWNITKPKKNKNKIDAFLNRAFYGQTIEEKFVLSRKNSFCPQCGNFSLEFESLRLFD